MGIAVASNATQTSWRVIHQTLVGLVARQAELDYELGLWLLAARRVGVHRHVGYGSFHEYAERLLGSRPRQTEERLRVAEALSELPALGEALRTGRLCWSVVRELCRVAVADNEREWLDWAEGRTARQVEAGVSGKSKGQGPTDPSDDAVRSYRLVLEVEAETLALFRDAVRKPRRETGEPLSQERALAMMLHRELAGSRRDGAGGFQVAMTVCERCGRGHVESQGELLPARASAVARSQARTGAAARSRPTWAKTTSRPRSGPT